MDDGIKTLSKSSGITRVVCCQGTIQLAVALNCVLRREREYLSKTPGMVLKNYLIVHDLYAPENQEEDFFRAISTIARSVMPWEKIIYMNSASLTRLHQIFSVKGYIAFQQEMNNIAGILATDEVYLSRNWQPGSQLLLSYFERAYKICYGDSIAMFFTEKYFSDKDLLTRLRLSKPGSALLSLKRNFVNLVKHPGRKPSFKTVGNPLFDYGYFCFPTLSGEAPNFPYEIIPVCDLRQTFERIVAHLPIALPEISVPASGEIAALLTTNFSEAKRMSVADEEIAYLNFVSNNVRGKATLLIKPHPRDSKEKIITISNGFRKQGHKVIVLDSPHLFFIPFEFLLLKLEIEKPGLVLRTKFFTVSSACLGIWFLFGAKPLVGLGDQAIRKYFNPRQVRGRIQHEKDLRSLMQKRAGNDL